MIITASPNPVIAEARSWIGTPFHHQGRVKGVGVDCAGLIIGVAHNLGLSDYDFTGYSRNPDGAMLQQILASQLQPIANPAPGAIALITFCRYPQHLAILADQCRMIHAYSVIGRVVEHSINATWRRRMLAYFRFKGD